MEMPEVVSHDVWVAARRKLLVKEKEWSLKRGGTTPTSQTGTLRMSSVDI